MIVIDSSAIIAILNHEPERMKFATIIANEKRPMISAVSVYETMVVLIRFRGDESAAEVIEFLNYAKAEVRPFDLAQAQLAQQAYITYGKGYNPASKLNLCDCAAFALAQTLSAPLLYKGEDFKATPVIAAA